MLNRDTAVTLRHDELIERMQQLGYPANSTGVCFGVAYMGMLAILAEDIATFDQRLADIKKIPENKFAHTIQRKKDDIIKKARIEAWLQHFPGSEQFNFDHLTKEQIKQYESEVRQRLTTLWELNASLLDIPVFFEGVEAGFKIRNYQHLLDKTVVIKESQDALLTSTRVFPLKLEKDSRDQIQDQPNLLKLAHFSGLYRKDELITYFNSLAKVGNKLTQPIALMLSSSNHAITIGFDSKLNQWLLIDANDLPTQHIDIRDTDKLSEEVLYAFSAPGKANDVTIFQTNIFAAKPYKKVLNQQGEVIKYVPDTDQASILQKHIDDWQQQEEFKKIHTVTIKKARSVCSDNSSWLYVAARAGLIDEVKSLLYFGARPNRTCKEDGFTSLHIAAQNGHLEVVNALLAEQEIDAGRPTKNGETPLHVAAYLGHFEIVEALLADPWSNPDSTIKDNDATPLHLAVLNGHVAIVKALLANPKVNPNSLFGEAGLTPLYLAAEAGHVDIVKALLADPRTDPNIARDDDGSTPLYTAVFNGRIDVVNALLADSRTNRHQARKSDHATPLFIACLTGDIVSVNALLKDPSIDPNVTCTDGISPLFIAAESGHADVVKALLAHPTINLNLTVTNADITPLYIAAQNGHSEVVKALANDTRININQAGKIYHAEISSVNELCANTPESFLPVAANLHGANSTTPLFIAAQLGHAEIVDLLISKGADITLSATKSISSINEFARLKKKQNSMQALIDQKRKDNKCWMITLTPLEMAKAMGYEKIVTSLEKAQAEESKKFILNDIFNELILKKALTQVTENKKSIDAKSVDDSAIDIKKAKPKEEFSINFDTVPFNGLIVTPEPVRPIVTPSAAANDKKFAKTPPVNDPVFDTEVMKCIKELSAYAEMRRREYAKQKLFKRTLFSINGTTKISAAIKMITLLENKSIEPFSKAELKALQKGRLGKMIEKYKHITSKQAVSYFESKMRKKAG